MLDFHTWCERQAAADARIQRMGNTPEEGIPTYQSGPGMPISIFPLDNELHSTLMYMEAPKEDGLPFKGAIVIGGGTSSLNPYNPRVVIIPCDIIRIRKESAKDDTPESYQHTILAFYDPGTAPNSTEKVIREYRPPVVKPPAVDPERQKYLAYLGQFQIGVPASWPTEKIRQLAVLYGYSAGK